MLNSETVLNELFAALPYLKDFHGRNCNIYALLEIINKSCIEDLFSSNSDQRVSLKQFGNIQIPFYSMGAINSTHLFGLDEIIIFSFYAMNAGRYKCVADLGANIGLHTIMMSKLGFYVTSYEPDPVTFERLKKNIALNGVIDKVKSVQKAVSTQSGKLEFTRVLGNTTGSHISGAKENPYGELERFDVEVDCFLDIMKTVDLMKIDVEGHESDILCNTAHSDWEVVDAMVEIGTGVNANRVYAHMRDINLNMFSQKNGWKRVETIEEVPTTYKEGSLFISTKEVMPWGGGC